MMQMGLSILVLFEVLGAEGWDTFPETTMIVTSRFVCGIVLHVFLQGELEQGCNFMKYATNHPWKFDDNGGMFLAWLSGFLQASMILVVESVNYVALITNTTHIDVVMNFLALAVIADFDDFFYGALFDTEYKKVITETDVYQNFLVN